MKSDTPAPYGDLGAVEPLTFLIGGSGLGLCLLIGFAALTALMVARG